MSQKDAESLIFKLMLFAQAISQEEHGKLPILNLINQCHQVISSNESLIFQNQEEKKDDPHSAIDRLYRAEMVRIVYDPDGSIMKKEMQGENVDSDEEMKQDVDSDDMDIPAPKITSKSKSVGLPFMHIGHSQTTKEESHKSEVYQFRDKCFSILKKLQIDIRYAENFWLLEERLKKVDTISKAKSYGGDDKIRVLRGMFGGKLNDQVDEISNKFDEIEMEEY